MMDATQAKALKYGDKVRYLGSFDAIVQTVRANGVVIAFDGRGLKAGEYIHRRVAARDIERA